jgi:acyl carrier protein
MVPAVGQVYRIRYVRNESTHYEQDSTGCARARQDTTSTDDLVLLDSGLDSLGIAVLIARLEDWLAINPFSTSEESQLPLTIGDIVKAYENRTRSGSVFAKSTTRSGRRKGLTSRDFSLSSERLRSAQAPWVEIERKPTLKPIKAHPRFKRAIIGSNRRHAARPSKISNTVPSKACRHVEWCLGRFRLLPYSKRSFSSPDLAVRRIVIVESPPAFRSRLIFTRTEPSARARFPSGTLRKRRPFSGQPARSSGRTSRPEVICAAHKARQMLGVFRLKI